MKKFNGTDYDSLLPLAYNALNSQQLDGKTFNEIQNLFDETSVKIFTPSSVGTGTTVSQSSPKEITAPFPLIGVSIGNSNNTGTYRQMEEGAWVFLNSFPNVDTYYIFKSGTGKIIHIKKSADNKTLTWYTNDNTWNLADVKYGVFCIGRYNYDKYPNRKEWLITRDSTWIVPYTGNYMVELYGGGGYGSSFKYRNDNNTSVFVYAEGGSSCQNYSSLYLTQNSTKAITIGKGAYINTSPVGNTLVNATGTKFRNYSVAGGRNGKTSRSNASDAVAEGGAGAGNKGTIRKSSTNSFLVDYGVNYSNGIYAKRFGYSYGMEERSYKPAGNGAVYIKYLD